MAKAEPILRLAFPNIYEQAEDASAETDASAEKLPGGSRLGVILLGAFASWTALVAIAWAIVTTARAFLGH